MREKAIQKLVEEQRSRQISQKNTPDLTVGDYFHDGREVLLDVRSWHNVLRSALRKTDSVTSQVLELVEQKMLLGNPELRIKAKGICTELKYILSRSREEPRNIIPEIIMKSLLDVEDEAADPISIGTIRQLEQALTSSHDRQNRKSKMLTLPIMKTTHRSEYLESALKQIASDVIYESPMEQRVTPAASQAQMRPNVPTTPERSLANQELVDAQVSRDIPFPNPSSMSMTPRGLRRAKTSKPEDPKDVWQAREEIEKRESRIIKIRTKKDELLTRYFRDRDIVSPLIQLSHTLNTNMSLTEILGRQRRNYATILVPNDISTRNAGNEGFRPR